MSTQSTSPYLKALAELMSERPEVVCVTCGEQAQSQLEERAPNLPQGLIALPHAPSAAVAFCAGLAREGMRPFLHAQASTLIRGGYEMILTQLSAPCLPVRLIGLDAGLSHEGGLGAQAVDDLSALATLPQLGVFEPGDQGELFALPKLIDDVNGPVYMRATLGEAPALFDEPPRLGHLRCIEEGEELVIVSAGRCTAEVLRLKDALKEAKFSVTHLHATELSPLPTLELRERLEERSFRAIITMEEHLSPGPLSSGISALLSESLELKSSPVHVPLALHQTFAQGGQPAYLRRKYGVDAGALLAAIERSLKRRVGVTVSELPSSAWR
jgi:transketolase